MIRQLVKTNVAAFVFAAVVVSLFPGEWATYWAALGIAAVIQIGANMFVAAIMPWIER